MAAGKPAAEDFDVEGWNVGGEGHLAEEERRRWRGGGDGAHEDLVAEHGGECDRTPNLLLNLLQQHRRTGCNRGKTGDPTALG